MAAAFKGTSLSMESTYAIKYSLQKLIIFIQNFFKKLRDEGYFSKDVPADLIALLALYMPILREEVYHFVRTWNSHTIRKQPNRPNILTGKPYMLYNHPGDHVRNWGLEFDAELLRTIGSEARDWDVDAYLPAETLQWCEGQLHILGFNRITAKLATSEDRTAPFVDVYLELRRAIREHIESGVAPQLSTLQNPVGAHTWQVSSSPYKLIGFN